MRLMVWGVFLHQIEPQAVVSSDNDNHSHLGVYKGYAIPHGYYAKSS